MQGAWWNHARDPFLLHAGAVRFSSIFGKKGRRASGVRNICESPPGKRRTGRPNTRKTGRELPQQEASVRERFSGYGYP